MDMDKKLTLCIKIIETKQKQGVTCLALLGFIKRIIKRNPQLKKFEWQIMSAIFN